jgi:hypothetical protein
MILNWVLFTSTELTIYVEAEKLVFCKFGDYNVYMDTRESSYPLSALWAIIRNRFATLLSPVKLPIGERNFVQSAWKHTVWHKHCYNYMKLLWIKDFYLLRHNTVHSVEKQPTFRRNSLPPPSCWFIACLTLQPWRWLRQFLPNRPLIFNGPQGVISQKIQFFIITDVTTSNPTSLRVWINCSMCSQQLKVKIL